MVLWCFCIGQNTLTSDTGTWTITLTTPNGLTCLVASGQSWEELAEALPPDGDDA